MQVLMLNVALAVIVVAGALIAVFTALCWVSLFTKRDYVIEFLNLYREDRP